MVSDRLKPVSQYDQITPQVRVRCLGQLQLRLGKQRPSFGQITASLGGLRSQPRDDRTPLRVPGLIG